MTEFNCCGTHIDSEDNFVPSAKRLKWKVLLPSLCFITTVSTEEITNSSKGFVSKNMRKSTGLSCFPAVDKTAQYVSCREIS